MMELQQSLKSSFGQKVNQYIIFLLSENSYPLRALSQIYLFVAVVTNKVQNRDNLNPGSRHHYFACVGYAKNLMELIIDMEKKDLESLEKINTTIGDLIEAVTQIALEAGKSEEEGYLLAQATLESILRRNRSERVAIN
jgi:hypothetical protein